MQGKGQYCGEVLLRQGEDGLSVKNGSRRMLGPDISSQADIVQRIREYQLSLKDLDLLGTHDDSSPYLGSRACSACHTEQFRNWKKSAHATSLSPLRADKGLFDPHKPSLAAPSHRGQECLAR